MMIVDNVMLGINFKEFPFGIDAINAVVYSIKLDEGFTPFDAIFQT